jgi:hypothetical protein
LVLAPFLYRLSTHHDSHENRHSQEAADNAAHQRPRIAAAAGGRRVLLKGQCGGRTGCVGGVTKDMFKVFEAFLPCF